MFFHCLMYDTRLAGVREERGNTMHLILCFDRWWQAEHGARKYRTTFSLATGLCEK